MFVLSIMSACAELGVDGAGFQVHFEKAMKNSKAPLLSASEKGGYWVEGDVCLFSWVGDTINFYSSAVFLIVH